MSLDVALQFVPTFVLVMFRIAGMMLFAPLFGSARIPKRVRALIALILAMAMTKAISTQGPPVVNLPSDIWLVALGIGGEMIFGLAMGMILSFVFISAQWAGDMIGQQMGLNLSEVFDPQYGSHGSLIGDLYYMLTLVVFLTAQGHHAMIQGVRASFDALPLMSLGMNANLLDLLFGLFAGATELALRLAGPVFVTMLIVDVALGFIGKTMPQMNVMSAGLSIRSMMGIGVLLVGVGISSDVLQASVFESMTAVTQAWVGLLPVG